MAKRKKQTLLHLDGMRTWKKPVLDPSRCVGTAVFPPLGSPHTAWFLGCRGQSERYLRPKKTERSLTPCEFGTELCGSVLENKHCHHSSFAPLSTQMAQNILKLQYPKIHKLKIHSRVVSQGPVISKPHGTVYFEL